MPFVPGHRPGNYILQPSEARGDRVEIRGFGTFSVKKYKPYKGRNPKTGEKISVPPKKLPLFKVGLAPSINK